MPNIETPEELAEQIANWVGVYGSGLDDEHDEPLHKAHQCRVCFVSALTHRIRQSVANEQALQRRAGEEQV